MGRTFRARVAVALVSVVLALAAPSAVPAQDDLLKGEWIGSFGCDGDLTYIRMSVGADQVALHAFNGTVLYRISEQSADGFTALQLPSVEPLSRPFPASIVAHLMEPEDLLTGSLEGWMEAVTPGCTRFMLVRIVQWPKT